MSKLVLVIMAFGVVLRWGYKRGMEEDALRRRLTCALREVRDWQNEARNLYFEIHPELRKFDEDQTP